ncbi:MAG: ATP-dependent helicase HrpB [Pseudomonadota bacterium]
MSDALSLPIDDVLPAIRAAVSSGNRLVLAAPPGAGKTTRVPLDLLNADWLEGRRILLLEPRRIAARMAAARMAATLGERVGETVGLATRVDRKVSKTTRIEVITDGLFTRRLLNDPELSGVGAVLFDEFHERSLNLDLGLALALDAQTALREDLRLVLMSATLDTARVAKAIGAPVVESDGRMHPVETRYLGKPDGRLEDGVAAAVRRALREETGSILVFLPGQGEILRTAERLNDLPPDIAVAPLYGALSPADQDAAVRPAPAGARKVVLATDIAESSLTIEGVRVVIDAGLARVPDYDPGGGVRLVTRRAARANVDQRRGRAGRTEPGVCYRLWDEAETRGLVAEPRPEILASDLSGLLLSLAEWGERDPARLTWVDPPPAGRVAGARDLLTELGALDADGALTDRGRAMARLPLPPRLAAMVAGLSDPAERALAGEVALLVGERGLGGASADIRDRLERFRRDGSNRAKALRNQARAWADGAEPAPVKETARIIAAGLPGAIARARPGKPGEYLLASGRGGRLDPADPLAKSEWLAVIDLAGSAASARITAAAPLSEADALGASQAETVELADFDPAAGALSARRVKRIGAIILSETPLPKPSGAAARTALLDALRAHGLDLVASARAIRETQARLRLVREADAEAWPDWSDDALLEALDIWATPLLGDPPSLARPKEDEIRRALAAMLDWETAQALDTLAPLTLRTPAGRAIPIDYLAEGGPQAEARVQEFYGLAEHPRILGGRLALTLSLLSPARRPVAVTQDLPGFWAGGYRDMAKDMRGRYPKHDWPDDPATAAAHEGRTKARLKNG